MDPWRGHPLTRIGPHRQKDCYALCCNGYFHTQYLTTLAKPALTVEIHPLFSILHWTDFHLFNYKTLEQSLRLCTHLLEVSLPFWHALFFGRIEELRDQRTTLGARCFRLRSSSLRDDLTSVQEAKTREKLEELGTFVTFGPWENQIDSSACRGSLIDSHPLFCGRTGEIYIGQKLIDDLEFAADGRADDACLLWTSFLTAVSIVHELAHAAANARWREMADGGSLFFPGQLVAEDGFMLEYYLFGGRMKLEQLCGQWGHIPELIAFEYYNIDGRQSDLPGMIVMEDWPSKGLVDFYEEQSLAIGVCGELPNVYAKWHVPFRFFDAIFQEENWSTRTRQEALKALRLRRLSGQQFCTTTTSDNKYYPPPDGFQLHVMSGFLLRQYYNMDEAGTIFPTL